MTRTSDRKISCGSDSSYFAIAAHQLLQWSFIEPMKTASLPFFIAIVLATGVALVRGQSALDGFDPNANGSIHVVVVQPDGKILIGGDFTSLSPNGGTAVFRSHMARLNPDGTLDPTFDPRPNATVRTIVVQPDGRILIGGDFTVVNSLPRVLRNHIARLIPTTGQVDSFDPNANDVVRSIGLQRDGRILAGGDFTALSPNGGATVGRNHIARVDATGLADSFNPNANGHVLSIVVQAERILAGGKFTSIGGQPRNFIARLDAAEGSADSFDPSANGVVDSIAVQADGKILVGGGFTSIRDQPRNFIARLDAAEGSADSFDPSANGVVFSIAVQAEGKIVAGGSFTSIGGQPRHRIARLDAIKGLADSFNPNANNQVFAIAVQQDGKIVAGGFFNGANSMGSQMRNFVARLEIDGRSDQTFTFGSGTVFEVTATAVQTDGKILIGGLFSIFGTTHLLRFNTDGTLDGTFTGSNDPDNDALAIAVQADGKIVVGGQFMTFGGSVVPRNHLLRLNADGTLDMSFDPNAGNQVNAIVIQPDGKILIGGAFNTLSPNGGPMVTAHHIARLNPNGTLDNTFNSNADNTVACLALQSDGKILVGGFFTGIANSAAHGYFARLNSDGTLDPNFTVANYDVEAIAVQEDGKILVGGLFSMIGVTPRARMARVNLDGTVDPDFKPNSNFDIHSIAVQADGKVVVGGNFTNIGGQPRNLIARLDRRTGLADSFNPNVIENDPSQGIVRSLAILQDGKIVVGGFFDSVGGLPRQSLARLSNDTAALQNLTVTSNSVTLTHGGASPQFRRVIFESSTDNVNFISLGNGTASSGSWILSSLNLPIGQNFFIRARGFYGTGQSNGSESALGTRRSAFFPGNFVIGDRNAVIGQHVVFWGAQWATQNSLTGGPAPASFKGFANSPSKNQAACGGTWKSDPGNSSAPPSGVPANINVIVASSITQSGDVISGDIPEMAVVQTDPGYNSNSGHVGTGTIVSVGCGGQ